ncbi:MAG: endonuclease [Paracoccaceae bacterium]|nr:endonuclease [Paracoccaceae bacterium]
MGWTGVIITGLVATGVSGLMLSWTLCQPLQLLHKASVGRAETSASDDQPAATLMTEPANEDLKPVSAVVFEPAIPSVALAGEDELAGLKGDWKYGLGSQEDSSVGAASQDGPTRLDDPIEGAGNDLKKIEGLGPKLEKFFNSMSFYRFHQIADWTAHDVDWADQNLVGFKGRVSRDKWIEQAKGLAAVD